MLWLKPRSGERAFISQGPGTSRISGGSREGEGGSEGDRRPGGRPFLSWRDVDGELPVAPGDVGGEGADAGADHPHRDHARLAVAHEDAARGGDESGVEADGGAAVGGAEARAKLEQVADV